MRAVRSLSWAFALCAFADVSVSAQTPAPASPAASTVKADGVTVDTQNGYARILSTSRNQHQSPRKSPIVCLPYVSAGPSPSISMHSPRASAICQHRTARQGRTDLSLCVEKTAGAAHLDPIQSDRGRPCSGQFQRPAARPAAAAAARGQECAARNRHAAGRQDARW